MSAVSTNFCQKCYGRGCGCSGTPQKTWIKPSGSWASWKNVVSGDYNRVLCDNCGDCGAGPGVPGAYPVNRIVAPQPIPAVVTGHSHRAYQDHRMENHPGRIGDRYVNYFSVDNPRPVYAEYEKGWWPDEVKQLTRTAYGADASYGTCMHTR